LDIADFNQPGHDEFADSVFHDGRWMTPVEPSRMAVTC